MIKRMLVIVIFFLLCFSARAILASESNGTINSSFKYAWGENLGWINFSPDHGGLSISDTAVSGYVWSRNFGWINFSPTNGGVTNNTSGQLGGYAWSTHKGWINMSGASINSSGKFTGTAGSQGSNAGRITFDCDHCDVRTDWRPSSARSVTLSMPSAASGGAYTPFVLNYVTSVNKSLEILPDEAGVLTINTKAGNVVLQVSPGTVKNKVTFSVTEKPKTSKDNSLITVGTVLINNAFYEVVAVDQNGQLVHYFDWPLTITLPIPANLVGSRNLAIYWLDEKNNQWVQIPDALFTTSNVIFTVSHLTKFAIFSSATGMVSKPIIPIGKLSASISISSGKIIEKEKEAAKQQNLIKATTTSIITASTTTSGKATTSIKKVGKLTPISIGIGGIGIIILIILISIL